MMRFILSILLLSLVVIYQNCGDVQLEPEQRVLESLINIKNPQGHICPGTSPTTGEEVKILFIIDMSISNIGSFYRSGGFLYLNKENAFDLDGLRFQAVKNFINNCGQTENAAYSVIGFAGEAMFGQPSSGMIRDCNSAFTTNKSLANSFVNDLKKVQDADLALGPIPENLGYKYQMGQTSYKEALRCADTNIKMDIAMNYNSSAFYQVFFITDGKPNEGFATYSGGNDFCDGEPQCEAMFSVCVGSPDYETCMENVFNQEFYASQINSTAERIQAANTSFGFLPLFYGDEEEYPVAAEILDSIAEVVDPEIKTERIENIADITDTLCASLNPETEIPYMLSEPYAINLTAKEVNGTWYADSDMDGLIDIEDANPQNARTDGYLDGICVDYFNGNCPAVGSACQNNFISPFINECEKDIIPNTNLMGLDSDGDGLLDFVEIIKGTNPSINDSLQQDFDGDGKSNYQEILIGTNPRKPSPFHLIKRYTEIDMSSVDPQYCDQGLNGYSFELTNFPFAEEVLSYVDPNIGLWNLSHDEGENVFLIYYIADPLSANPELKKKVYASIIRLKNHSNTTIELKQNDFKLLGELP